jgi:hypothetical protein
MVEGGSFIIMASDPARLISQVRFALARLSERNAQHEWEHLCRHFTRERLCSNILPATGPVQAGGDQGRDFETFHTYLSRSSLGGRSFVGLLSEKPIVFACSLEERVIPKMRRDVTTIMSKGTPVERIYLFSTRGVPVAKRHTLLEWAQTTYKVALEILDGEAMAEQLSVPDIFWIAERFLELPRDLLPPPPQRGTDADDWYTQVLNKWRRIVWSPQTFADFTEIRTAAREALGPFDYTEDGHPIPHAERTELPFWIDLLDEVAEHIPVDVLRRHARYEATVLRLRGLGTLLGQEGRLRQYFATIEQLEDIADLEDTETLLAYLFPASRLGFVHLTSIELQTWKDALEARLDDRLRDAEKYGRLNTRCMLLETRGHLALVRSVDQGKLDIDGALFYWNRLAQLAKKAPLFPLERFAERLTQYVQYIEIHPTYNLLTQTVDTLMAERFGSFKVAEQCLARAKALQKAGSLPRAMEQLHRAKFDWFAEETLGKALFALIWLSQAYTQQGLFFAAKYYALAAAYIAVNAKDIHPKRIVARCLEAAASCDYATGAWQGFLELAEISLIFHWQFVPEPDADLEKPHGVVQPLIFHLSQLLVTTKLLYPNNELFACERCSKIVERVRLDDLLEEARTLTEQQWSDGEPEALWNAIEEQIAGAPWSDAGPVRQAEWKAHGVTWHAQWDNTYETTLAAEEFLSALQIILSDFAGKDLCLMRSTLHFSVRLAVSDGQSLSGYKGFDVQFESSNEQRHAQVLLPPYHHFVDGLLTYKDLHMGALSIAYELLTEVSLLPTEQFQQMMEKCLNSGLLSKIHVGASYAQCFRLFVSQDIFEASERTTRTGLSTSHTFVSRYPQVLSWRDTPGPGYDSEKAHEYIENRYRRFLRPITRTLQRLAREATFQATVTQLRAEGWKDWHLLVAVSHITMNYRINQRKILLLSPQAEDAAARRLWSQPEPEDALPVPLSEYREENMRLQMKLFMSSFAGTFGLELHQFTPDFAALEDFLAHRYNFWSDDIDHTDPFALS